MKTAITVVSVAVLVFSAAVGRAEDFKVTVYTTDNQKLKATLSEESFGIRTPYGTLQVATKDIRAMYPGFGTSKTSRKRVASYIAKLGGPQADSAIRSLVNGGRVSIPQLQEAAESKDKQVAKKAAEALKLMWPTGAKVPSDGSAVIRTRDCEFRGTLTWLHLPLRGAFGRKTLRRTGIQLVQFGVGKAQPAGDAPKYGPLKRGRYPELELTLNDSTRIIGTFDTYSVDVETPYGALKVPVKRIISITLGDPDTIVTRDMSFTGKLATATLEVKSKVGSFKVDRDKVAVLKAVLDQAAVAVAEEDGIRPNQWTDIFNGKDLTGWSKWGKDGGKIKVARGRVNVAGDAGMSYHEGDDMEDVILAARVRINRTVGGGPGVKLILRDTGEGQYYIHYDGKNGFVAIWNNKTKKSSVLKRFQAAPASGNWHSMQFGVLGSTMLAYVNGRPVGEVKIDAKQVLPAGKVGIGVWNTDASYRDIRVKLLK